MPCGQMWSGLRLSSRSKSGGRRAAIVEIHELFSIADRDQISVYWMDMESTESLSCCLPDGSCAVALDPWKLRSLADEKVKLAHEIGHCETGSFYNQYAAYDLRCKHERRADKWAYQALVPEEALLEAVRAGYVESWELAEYFDVPEDFIKRAYEYYQTKKIACPSWTRQVGRGQIQKHLLSLLTNIILCATVILPGGKRHEKLLIKRCHPNTECRWLV